MSYSLKAFSGVAACLVLALLVSGTAAAPDIDAVQHSMTSMMRKLHQEAGVIPCPLPANTTLNFTEINTACGEW